MSRPLHTFSSIQEIRDWKFAGNHYNDWAVFNGIEAFVANTNNSIADRAEALRIMGRDGMGLVGEQNGDHMSDEELLADWQKAQDR